MNNINYNSKKLKNKIKILKSNTIENLYISIMFFLIVCFLIAFILVPSGIQAKVFFMKTGDYMGDYSNLLKGVSDSNPYFGELKGSYLPLTYIIYNILTRFTESSKSGDYLLDKAVASLFFFTLYSSFILILYEKLNLSNVKKFIFMLIFIFSGIFLFSYERGNLIILASLFSTVYIFNYKSNSKFIREISFLCLAMAAAMKIYPALLGVLLLYEKRSAEAIRLFVYGVVISIMPFLFISGGFHNLWQWILNIKSMETAYISNFYPRFGLYYFFSRWNDFPALNKFISRETLITIYTFSIYLLSFAACLLSGFETAEWKRIGIIICVVILLPVNSALYCGLYFFPVIILFFNEKDHTFKDMYYVLLFILLLNPFQFVLQLRGFSINFSTVFTNLSVFVLFMSLTFGLFQKSNIGFSNLQNLNIKITQINK